MILLCILLLAVAGTLAHMVDCDTTKGQFSIQLEPTWAPLGVERFLLLVDSGFYTNLPLLRCIDDFLCQFGYSGNPLPLAELDDNIPDDDDADEEIKQNRFKGKFQQGYASFAGNGVNSRSRHVFITLGKHVESLGTMPWETPIGRVTPASFERTVTKFNTQYDDSIDPNEVEANGVDFTRDRYPELDYILHCARRRERNKEL